MLKILLNALFVKISSFFLYAIDGNFSLIFLMRHGLWELYGVLKFSPRGFWCRLFIQLVRLREEERVTGIDLQRERLDTLRYHVGHNYHHLFHRHTQLVFGLQNIISFFFNMIHLKFLPIYFYTR